MKWFAPTVALTALLGCPALAQQPPAVVVLPTNPVVVPTGSPVSPTIGGGYIRSGGVRVGANGYFPYDTGNYLLGGTEGFARSTGYFSMVPAPPAGDVGAVGLPLAPAVNCFAPGPTVYRAGHFRR